MYQGRLPPGETIYLYVRFCHSLMNLGIVNAWIPKILTSYQTAKEGCSPSDFVDPYALVNYNYCKMKYYFLRGGKSNHKAITCGTKLFEMYETNRYDVWDDTDPDNNYGKFL